MTHPSDDGRSQDWERAMGAEFDRRVRGLHEAPLSLDQVKGAATTIRRRRRALVAGAVLAAVALIAPTALLVLDDGDAETIQPADPTPSVAIESDEPSPTPDPTTPTPPPNPSNPLGIDYLEGSTWVRSDRDALELPDAYQGGTRVGPDMFLGFIFDNQGVRIDEVDEEGELVDSVEALSGVASNDAHTVAAYVNQDGSMEIRSATDRATVPVTFAEGDEPVTVVGDADCIAQESCLVFVNPLLEDPPTVVSMDGVAAPLTNGIVDVSDADGTDAIAGIVSVQDEGSCSSVFAGAAGQALFENCEFRYFSFSPDGRYLSGSQAYGDGFGDGLAGIYSAQDGSEIARYEPPSQAIVETMWQDAENLLVLSYDFDAGTWQVVRLSTDGSDEVVLGPVDAGQDERPFTLLGGP